MAETDGRRAAFLRHVEKVQAEYLGLRLSEADTRSYLVDPVLTLLGYGGVKHLRREVPVPATREFIDYELLVEGTPHAIVEAKAIRHSISAQHAAQCVQYASILGVRWCLITNGVAWALYDAHAKGPLDDKRVAEVALDGDSVASARAWSVLSLFARDAVAASSPLTRLLIERVVADELADPDSPAIAALRRAVQRRFGERVSGGAVVDGLGGRTERPAATAPPADTATSSGDPDPEQPVGTARPRQAERRGKTRTRVTLTDLVAAGLLPADAVLEARVQGVSHIARIRDGAIEVDGSRYETPSAASAALRHRKSWNGWVDWRYKGERLADVREQFRKRRSSDAPASPP